MKDIVRPDFKAMQERIKENKDRLVIYNGMDTCDKRFQVYRTSAVEQLEQIARTDLPKAVEYGLELERRNKVLEMAIIMQVKERYANLSRAGHAQIFINAAEAKIKEESDG